MNATPSKPPLNWINDDVVVVGNTRLQISHAITPKGPVYSVQTGAVYGGRSGPFVRERDLEDLAEASLKARKLIGEMRRAWESVNAPGVQP